MRAVAGEAAVAESLMLGDERPALRQVALLALLVVGQHGTRSARHRPSPVRVVAVGAVRFALNHRVMAWQ
jgi:hypothetical protein